jgi:hypothetical protein
MDAIARIETHVRNVDGGFVESNSILSRLVRFYKATEYGCWFIRDVHARIVPFRLNTSQLRLLAAMMDQAAEDRPIRQIILKTRKTGISTFVQVLFVELCAYYPQQRARTIAHEATATDDIFDIGRLAAKVHEARGGKVLEREIRFADVGSEYICQTAGGVAVGAGGTPNLLHLSEGPKWERNKAETHYNATIAVPDVPESIIVEEFTAKGRELFYQRWSDADAEVLPGWHAIFIPWWTDERCTLAAPDDFARTDEQRLIAGRAHAQGVELSDGQLYWRQCKIAELGPEVFRQEYPATPAEAIQGAKGIIFPNMRDALVRELPFLVREVPRDDRVGGIDFGYNDPTVIWTGYYHDQVLWVTDYWRRAETLAAEQVEAIHDGHMYFCDPANVTERTALIRAGEAAGKHCRFAAAPRRKNAGEEIARVELQSVLRLLNEGRLRIDYKIAAQLIVECDTLAWNEKTGKPDEQRSEACGHYDSIMALKYMVMGVLNRTPPKPASDPIVIPSRRKQFLAI